MNTKPSSPSSPLSETLSRRHFSKLLATSALGTLAAPAFLHGQNLNTKLNIAIIGAGGRGGGNMGDVGRTENIVAVCDVAEAALDSAQKKFPQAKRFTDFRKLYEAETEFDALVVSTCEHTHAFATLPALKLRKHVYYCEKPLTYNIWEARVIRRSCARPTPARRTSSFSERIARAGSWRSTRAHGACTSQSLAQDSTHENIPPDNMDHRGLRGGGRGRG
jgi:hypothetical protein